MSVSQKQLHFRMTSIGGPRWLIGVLTAVIAATVLMLGWGIVRQTEYSDLSTISAPSLASADIELVRLACGKALKPLLSPGTAVDNTYPVWSGNHWVQAGQVGGRRYICQVSGLDAEHLKAAAKLK